MTNWTTGICKANGIEIHYSRTGGDKPPVVLLHGLMLMGACWIDLASSLEKEYDIIMPDARGHGHSSSPAHGYHYEDLASDVVGLIDELGLTAPVLLGHSMGGMTAAMVASWDPKRLRGLILADPTFLSPQRQHEVYQSDVVYQHRRILNQPKEKLITTMRARPKKRPERVIELFALARFQTSEHAFEILRPPNPDYIQLINTINVPSLLIIGDTGAVVSPEMATELAGLNHRLEIVQIAESGHAVPYDQPEHFSTIVKKFLHSLNE